MDRRVCVVTVSSNRLPRSRQGDVTGRYLLSSCGIHGPSMHLPQRYTAQGSSGDTYLVKMSGRYGIVFSAEESQSGENETYDRSLSCFSVRFQASAAKPYSRMNLTDKG